MSGDEGKMETGEESEHWSWRQEGTKLETVQRGEPLHLVQQYNLLDASRRNVEGLGQLLAEAQTRWLKCPEVGDLLLNYQSYGFHLSKTPPQQPPAGTLFLFDRKACRRFRKDGHNWRKKKDGKTVRETHEKLKVGTVDLLNCYYAHAEDAVWFQRRSYWLLDDKEGEVVLVHYLQVPQGTGSARILGSRGAGGRAQRVEELDSPLSGSSPNSLAEAYELALQDGLNRDSRSSTSDSMSLPAAPSANQVLAASSLLRGFSGGISMSFNDDFVDMHTLDHRHRQAPPTSGGDEQEENFQDQEVPLDLTKSLDLYRFFNSQPDVAGSDAGQHTWSFQVSTGMDKEGNVQPISLGMLERQTEMSQDGDPPPCFILNAASIFDPDGKLLPPNPAIPVAGAKEEGGECLPFGAISSEEIQQLQPGQTISKKIQVPKGTELVLSDTGVRVCKGSRTRGSSKAAGSSAAVTSKLSSDSQPSSTDTAIQAIDVLESHVVELEAMMGMSGTSARTATSESMNQSMVGARIEALTKDVILLQHVSGMTPSEEDFFELPSLSNFNSSHVQGALNTMQNQMHRMDLSDGHSGSDSDAKNPHSIGVLHKRVSNNAGSGPCTSAAQPPMVAPISENSTLFVTLSDLAPNWDWECGGSKMLVMFTSSFDSDQLLGAMLTLSFGNTKVLGELVQPGVVRCKVPPGIGTVPLMLAIMLGDTSLSSLPENFTFRAAPRSALNSNPTLSKESEREFYLRLVRMLVEVDQGRLNSADALASLGMGSTGSGTAKEGSPGVEGTAACAAAPGGKAAAGRAAHKRGGATLVLSRLNRANSAHLCALCGLVSPLNSASDDVLRRVLASLLERMLHTWMQLQPDSTINQKDNWGLGMIHLVGALGLSWAVRMLSQRGAHVDLGDSEDPEGALYFRAYSIPTLCTNLPARLAAPRALLSARAAAVSVTSRHKGSHALAWGCTALHWAAKFGRETTVSALIAAGSRPEVSARGCTPADVAVKNGYDGIAAFISERALQRYLLEFNTEQELTKESRLLDRASSVELLDVPSPRKLNVRNLRKRGHVTTDGESSGLESEAEAAAVATKAAAAAELIRCNQRPTGAGALAAEVLDQLPNGSHPKSPNSKMEVDRQASKKKGTALDVAQDGTLKTYQERQAFAKLREQIAMLQLHVRARVLRRETQRQRRSMDMSDVQDKVRQVRDRVKILCRSHSRRLRQKERAHPGQWHDDNSDDEGGLGDEGEDDLGTTDDECHEKDKKSLPPTTSAAPPPNTANHGMTPSIGYVDANLVEAVTRVQAIVRSKNARQQYNRLRDAAAECKDAKKEKKPTK